MIIKSLVKDDGMKFMLDTASIGGAVGTFFGFIPDIAALLTVVWLGLRILESDTIQELLGNKPKDRKDDDKDEYR